MTGTSSLARMCAVFDVTAGDDGAFAAESDGGTRAVVDGSQFLAQAVVVAARVSGRPVRTAKAVFSRPVAADRPVRLEPEVVHAGASMATVQVTVHQGDRRCVTVLALTGHRGASVIDQTAPGPDVGGPDDAYPCDMPMTGREIRLVDVADVNSDPTAGPPELHAWVRYDEVPGDPEIAQALLAHFTGHLSISTALRPHAGLHTGMAHESLSTAPLSIDVAFHAPPVWSGWLLYSHESIWAGAGAACVRGRVHTGDGVLLASFTQHAMIRAFTDDAATAIPAAARL